MKPTPRFTCGALALLALLPLASRAGEPTEAVNDPASEPLTHVLFTGADIRILHEGKLHPVRDVDGNSFVIRYADTSKSLDVPRAAKVKRVVLSRVQTLADRSATMANFMYERAYTPANDPRKKGMEAMQSAGALAGYSADLQNKADRTPATIIVPVQDGFGIKRVEVVNPDYLPAQQTAAFAQGISSGVIGAGGHHAGKISDELARELFDALELEFEVSSETLLKAAYMVVVAEYHTTDRPKDAETWIVAKSLGEVSSSPRRVRLLEGGLPPGYILEKVRVHLYDSGVEIATDLSENRASLTRDEAHEYLVIDHLSTHKTDTLPARIALAKLPEDWAARTKDPSIRQTCYVKVDEAGYVGGLFEDKACTEKVDNPYLEAVFKDVRFLPALENGKAVDSVAQVRLADLRRGRGSN